MSFGEGGGLIFYCSRHKDLILQNSKCNILFSHLLLRVNDEAITECDNYLRASHIKEVVDC